MTACVIAVGVCAFLPVGTSAVEGRCQDSQIPVQQLIKQLYEADFDQRERAEQQLIEIGSPAIDLLVTELIDCKPDVCSRIKRILHACAGKCDEAAFFRVLAVLRLRFEVSDERIKPMLEHWVSQRRAAVVAAWQDQGAVVTDPFQGLERGMVVGGLEQQIRMGVLPGRQIFEFEPDAVLKLPAKSKQPPATEKSEMEFGSQAELLKLVLGGTLEQNKKLVLGSKQGVAGDADVYEKVAAMAQKRPVTVTIGEDWEGDYSVFDFDKTTSVLPIGILELQKLEVNDALLAALKDHPLSSVVLNECSIAAGLKETLPPGVKTLTIRGAIEPADSLLVVSGESPMLNRIRFEKCKFGKMEASSLKDFGNLRAVDLVRIDIESDTFDGLSSVRLLRQLWLERCKFPASAFIEFQQKRPDVSIDFSAKAFLGVSSAGPFGRIPRQRVQEACVIGLVVPGEAADRAGMEAEDQVIKIGDQDVTNFDELRVVIAQYEIGEEAEIRVLRDGKELTLKAKLGTPSD